MLVSTRTGAGQDRGQRIRKNRKGTNTQHGVFRWPQQG